MNKIVVVLSCNDCPSYVNAKGQGDDFCEKAGKGLHNTWIPDWCPLDDED